MIILTERRANPNKHMRLKINFNTKDVKINRVIKFLVLSDLFFWGGWGLVNPIFALFIIGKVPGATVFTVGSAVAVYWVVKALFQIPVALYLDRHEGERDDFHALLLGLTLAGFAAMAFLLVESIVGLYVVIFLQAIAYGLYTPSWYAIFSRHLDKEHYSFDWSLDSTTVGIASGVAAFIGGVLATLFGFEAVFIVASIFSFTSAFLLFFIPNLILPKVTTPNQPIIPDHTPGKPNNIV